MPHHDYFDVGSRITVKREYQNLQTDITGEIIGISHEDVITVWYIILLDNPIDMSHNNIPHGRLPWKGMVFPGTALKHGS